MTNPASAAGRFTFPGTGLSANRMGYGAMQLAGPHVFGPPKNPDEARAVLREAITLGIDHIDTSDFFFPPRSKMSDAPSSSALFHWLIIVGCTPYSAASSDTVRSPLTASSATRALKPASWFLRFDMF